MDVVISSEELRDVKESIINNVFGKKPTIKLRKEKEAMYTCNHCGDVSTAEDINYCTMKAYCMNRKQRREYVPIEKTKMGDHRWYKCPTCSKDISRRNGWTDAIHKIDK